MLGYSPGSNMLMSFGRHQSSSNYSIFLSRGFNLIELMIVVAILGVTAALATPLFTTWIADTKTRTVAEALQNGVRLAQAEAIRRGVQVQFVLTNDSPIAKDVTASATGRNWVIQTMEFATPANTDVFVEGAALGSVSSVSLVTASAATITFNSLGRLTSPTKQVTYTLTNPKGERKLNVVISVAGKVRMCDPDISIATSPTGCS